MLKALWTELKKPWLSYSARITFTELRTNTCLDKLIKLMLLPAKKKTSYCYKRLNLSANWNKSRSVSSTERAKTSKERYTKSDVKATLN